MRRTLILSLAALACVAAIMPSCASPAPSAPSPAQIAGAWQADSTLASVSGGECIGEDLQNALGRRDVFLAALAGESTIDATITSQGNSTSCAYAGSNSSGGVALTMTSCRSARVLDVLCRTGDRRDLQIVGGSLQGRADSRTASGGGSEVTTWNVFASGSPRQVGVLTLTATFSWVFLGVPSSDYHVFTGTVFPGYADGTITIPADPNPWCLPCGWFH